ncbi:MAG: GNAT family N-acetyltransferase [Candidatus Lokiarchaeota archaeon]|nr:GNAT family N-acetyltransferase [Candidatus Lokiarchaeota archaeon]
MVEFIPTNLELHKQHLISLNEDYLTWIASEMQERYEINMVLLMGKTVSKYVENSIEDLSSYVPPTGIYYIIQKDSSIIGMGALRTLKKSIGEIKRMYIKPNYRGNGYGKKILELLLEKGKEFGFSSIRLDTGEFMTAAHRVYRLAGFQERERYLESEVPTFFLSHWLFMEKFF